MLREESVADDDADQLIVRLKIGKAKLKAFWDDYRAKKRASEYPLSGYASAPPPPPAAVVATPVKAAASTPSTTPRSLPASKNTPQPNGNHSRAASSSARQQQAQVKYDAKGGVDVDRWPGSDDTPVSS
jgi:SWI/SNF-related matrix-associated actin-dependent regulator of chromatin subfamily B protein 1